MRIRTDQDVCIGSGQCVLTEPAVFDQDDDGIVTLLAERADGDTAKRVRDAVHICPSQALSIVED